MKRDRRRHDHQPHRDDQSRGGNSPSAPGARGSRRGRADEETALTETPAAAAVSRRTELNHARKPRMAIGPAHASADEAQLYGVAPVLEALRAGRRPIERITIAEGAHEARLRDLFDAARRAGVPVRRVPRVELHRLAAGATHQGVVAHVAAAHYRTAEEILDELAARIGTDDPPLAVVLDGVEDPRNLGAIIRTAECTGAHAVFIPERRAVGLTETVAKAAAGALEYVPVARTVNVTRLIEELKERRIWTIGTSVDASQQYTAWDWTQPCALIFGGEGAGLRRLVSEHCDMLVRIPLRGRIASLNVSVAAGVILYEAVRQRTARAAAAYKEAPDVKNSAASGDREDDANLNL